MGTTYKTLPAVGLFVLCIAFAGVGCSQSPDIERNLDGGPTDTEDGGPIDTADGGPTDTGDADTNYTCDAACLPCPSLGCDCAPCTANGLQCPDTGTPWPDGGNRTCFDAI